MNSDPSKSNLEIIRIVGVGGYATVYLVKDKKKNELFCKKVIKRDGKNDNKIEEYAKNEVFIFFI